MPEEQKLFVENMCLLQTSKKSVEFLSKVQHFEQLIVKIFKGYKQNLSSGHTSLDQIQELKILSSIFDFTCFDILEPNLVKISCFSSVFYIIEEKQCFFVCSQILEEQSFENMESFLIPRTR